jgi:membrane associated rhomboid family serine protease
MSYQQIRPTSFNILPVVVKNILIINTILWLAETVFEKQLGFSLNENFGLYYPLSSLFSPVQYVSHLFLHGNFMHLLSNMFALWMFGTILENFWGPKRFLIYYFATGLGAAFIHTLSGWYEINELSKTISVYAAGPNMVDFLALMQNNVSYITRDGLDAINTFINQWEMMPDNAAVAHESIQYAKELIQYKMNIPTVGASGAVFGVLLAFGMLFPNNVIYLYFAIPIKAKYFVILYGLFELYSGFSNNPGDNVAHFAHLGGMLFGFFLIKFWNKTDRRNFY